MSFKRAHAVGAQWASFSGSYLVPKPGDAPSVFVRRVNKLIELGVGVPAERRTGKIGTDQEYEPADVLEIGVGLSLMNAGVPQREARDILVAYRNTIRPHLDRALAQALPPKETIILVLKPRGFPQSQKIRELRKDKLRSVPAFPFYEPKVIWGSAVTWKQFAADLSGRERELILIGLHDLAAVVSQYLKDAPPVRRGRQ